MTTAVLCLSMLLALGCQSGFRKQTHASQRCLSSDPRYVSSGAEVKFDKNQTKALEAYKLERDQRRAALAKDDQ